MISLDPIPAPRSGAERNRLASELAYWRAVKAAYPDWIAEIERALGAPTPCSLTPSEGRAA